MNDAPKSPTTTAQSSTRLVALTDWPKVHLWPPLGGLRHLVFHEHTNGFHKVVRRVGRRVLLDEAEFFRWIEEQNGHDPTDSRR